jgi:sulfite reductase (NADPH) flavoprotein alpha-component
MKILIYFGSQTGNSFELATRIDFFFRLNSNIPVSLFPINRFDFNSSASSNAESTKQQQFNIFCISTTGQGDPPDDSRDFWENLMKPNLNFNFNQNFCLFALGDSSYSRYNWVGLAVARRLEQLGGKLIEDVILCDERHQLGSDWAADVGFEKIKKFVENFDDSSDIPVYFDGNKNTFKVKFPVITKSNDSFDQQPKSSVTHRKTGKPDFVPANVQFNNRVTDINHFQETRKSSIILDSVLYFTRP